jgi:asparagine synthase (glutamine-hydrolysing)
LRAPFVAVALERYDRVAAAFSIEARHPYCDRRLAEFCLALPWNQTIRNGWPKTLVRRAIQGLVPDSVRLRGKIRARTRKGLPEFWVERHQERLRQLAAGGTASSLDGYVDRAALRATLDRRDAGTPRPEDVYNLWQVGVLDLWLSSPR